MLFKSRCVLQMRFIHKLTRLKMGLPIVSVKKEIATKTMFTYEDAIYALNGLQSNPAVLEMARKERSANSNKHLINTEKFLQRLHILPEDLDKLNIIHVSGTKGKGSTCAFSECILRHQGLKTGFYSSPHLVVVRERIRINGQPLSKEVFTSYFWHIYNQLKDCQIVDEERPMPTYFMFLTIMAFYIFLQEKVDIAVLEVGVGGLYDNTNIIRSPVAVGITSLGYDHLSVLGHTIEEIAFQKAGIFKPGVPAFTVSQVPEAMRILQTKALEVNCPLYVVPPLVTYSWEKTPVKLGVPGEIQTENASLALQLCQRWISCRGLDGMPKISTASIPTYSETGGHYQLPPTLALPFMVTSKFIQGLQNTIWPGRCQILHKGSITYFLDGAHTAESMENCIRWYSESSRRELSNKECVFRILLFNCTSDRKPETLLIPLVDQQFDLVIFCPNTIYKTKDSASDHSNFTVDPQTELRRCETNMKVWHHLLNSVFEEEASVTAISSSSVLSFISPRNVKTQTMIFSCLKDALQWISPEKYKMDLNSLTSHNLVSEGLIKADHVSVLITGSLHLVGNVLSLIDPGLQNTLKQ